MIIKWNKMWLLSEISSDAIYIIILVGAPPGVDYIMS